MPTPSIIFWRGLQRGMLLWPFPNADGVYHGAPLYVVAPIIVTLAGIAAIMVLVMSKSPKEKRKG